MAPRKISDLYVLLKINKKRWSVYESQRLDWADIWKTFGFREGRKLYGP